MNYFFSKEVALSIENAEARVTEELKKEGFGILTRIDAKKTLKKKLGRDMKEYIILGACNPPFAYEVLMTEENIGLMLPCNVIVRESEGGKTVVASINPAAAMQTVGNPGLEKTGLKVSEKLKKVIEKV